MAIGTSKYSLGAGSPDVAAGMRYFGGADYSHAIQTGHSNTEILAWLNSNMGKLSQGKKNQPGGGGLYDNIQASAQAEAAVAADQAKKQQENAAKQQQLDAIQKSFDDKLLQMQSSMTEQAATYEQNLSQMQNTLTAQANPQTRENVLGVKGASPYNAAKLDRQGIKGSFGRSGLRIKSLNI